MSVFLSPIDVLKKMNIFHIIKNVRLVSLTLGNILRENGTCLFFLMV